MIWRLLIVGDVADRGVLKFEGASAEISRGRSTNPDVDILLFGSGKLVFTGGKEPVDAEHAVDRINSQLEDLGLLGA